MLEQSIRFYRDGLGFSVELEADNYVRFATGNAQPALFPHERLAHDADVPPDGGGFSSITLAQLAESEADIRDLLDKANAAGGQITKPTQEVEEFNGYSG